MPRLALLNMLIGFSVLALAAMAGAFIATDITQGYLRDKVVLESWALLLQKSAHGHTNLFALVHVCFGLTMPYSALPMRVKGWQTVGLALGTLGMAVGMTVRSFLGPTDGVDVAELAVGGMLSAALVAIASHAFGLAAKLKARG